MRAKKERPRKVKLPELWEKVEAYNRKLIPLALVLLVGVIIYELFLHLENHALELTITIADYLIITIFVIDLVFLAIKSRNVRFFFRHYWLDILAVFPFVIFFNLIGYFVRVITAAERFVVGQAIFHEFVEVGKSTKVLVKGGRFAKIAARLLRLITKSKFISKLIAYLHPD